MSTSNNVRITPNAKSKALITPYQNKPTFGFVQLNQDIVTVEGGWIRNRKRSCLVRAEIANLTLFVGMYPERVLPGRIQVLEYVESMVPAAVVKQFLNAELAYEDRIKSYVKTTGNVGEELTSGGERILRFSDYDPSGLKQDVQVEHDNKEDLSRLRDARVKNAALPADQQDDTTTSAEEQEDVETADTDAVEQPEAVLEGTAE